MQALRDALALLVVILALATVRVAPAPQIDAIDLSPAQAAQHAQPAAQVRATIPAEAVVEAPLPAEARPARPAKPEGPTSCDKALAAKTHSAAGPGRKGVPCDV